MRELERSLAELNSEEGDVWRWQEETWCVPCVTGDSLF